MNIALRLEKDALAGGTATPSRLRTAFQILGKLAASLSVLGLLLGPAPSMGAPPSQVGKIRWGYYVPYDAKSLESLAAHLKDLDYVSPFWYQVDAQGNVSRMYEGKDDQEAVERLIRGASAKILPTVKNEPRNHDFSPVLAPGAARTQAIQSIVELVERRGYDGIHIDFEDIASEDRPNLSAFMSDLSQALRSRGKLVTQALAAKTEDKTTGWAGPFDYAALAQYSDLLVLMAYGYGTARPSSTAPIAWVDGSVEYAASQIPREKLLLGVPFYGYHWNTTTGRLIGSLRYSDSLDLARSHDATILYSQATEGANFTYSEGGEQHEVWFEDRRSLDAKLDFVARYGLRGAAGWRLGHEDPEVWPSFNARLAFRTWYLAEGATVKPFHTWLLVMNPNHEAANITVTFMKEGGDIVIRSYRVAPTSRLSIFANAVVPDAAISTRVDADRAVIVERAMYFGHDGHVSAGVNAPRYRWYLPGEKPGPRGEDTWILLMNPNPQPATATVTFYNGDGSTLRKDYALPPTSRRNIFLDREAPDAMFTSVEASLPIVAELSTYIDGGKGGYGWSGTPFPSKEWYFAEGYGGFDTTLILTNPSPELVRVSESYYLESGRTESYDSQFGPYAQRVGQVNYTIGAMAVLEGKPINVPFSVKISADGPMLTQRITLWAESKAPGQLWPTYRSGHSSLGATAPATTWYFAEGSTAPPFETWLAVMNPNPMNVDITITFMREDGVNIVRGYQAGPHARLTIRASREVPNSAISMKVESSLPVVVERSMYFGIGGHNAVGVAQ